MSRLPSDLAAAVRILRDLPDSDDLALERWNDGTAVLDDVPRFTDDTVRSDIGRQIVELSLPFKRLIAAGCEIPIGSDLASIVGHLAAVPIDVLPDPRLVQRLQDLLAGYPTDNEETVSRHRTNLLCAWVLGAPDGLPFRRAMAEGDFGQDAATSEPPAGIGPSTCPIGCGFGSNPSECACTGTASERSVDIHRRRDAERAQRPTPRQMATGPHPDAANPGQARPTLPEATPGTRARSTQGFIEEASPMTEVPTVPYSEPGTGQPPVARPNSARQQLIQRAHRRLR